MSQKFYDQYKALIEQKGGKLISTEFVDSKTKLEYLCEKNHQCCKKPHEIKHVFCTTCAKENELEDKINTYKLLIKDKGGVYVSYDDETGNVEFICVNKHNLITDIRNIKQGKWCFKCHMIKCKNEAFNTYKKAIEKIDGKCITTEETYVPSTAGTKNWKIKWICKEGHEQTISPDLIMNEKTNYCRECKKNEPKGLKGEEKEIHEKNLAIIKEAMGDHGGYCVTKPLLDIAGILKWRCGNAHYWEATIEEMKKSWCLKCEDIRTSKAQKKYSFFKSLVEKVGYKMKSTIYVDLQTKLEYYCNKNHLCRQMPKELKKKPVCHICSGTNHSLVYGSTEQRKEHIENRLTGRYNFYKTIIENKGDMLISTVYIDDETPIEFTCSNNHNVKLLPPSLSRDGWCVECSYLTKKIDSFNRYKRMIEDNGGMCVSTFKDYDGSDTALEWICKNNHTMTTKFHCFAGGEYRCTECNKDQHKIEVLKKLQQIAKDRGGKCISTTYNGPDEKLIWECADGHQWDTRPSIITDSKSWCPRCKTYLKEQICCYIFETMFGKPFIKIRPNWLSTGKKNLELDGFCENLNDEGLKLAFEYNGQFHYHSIMGSDVDYVKKNDALKKKLCEENNVKLIVIPYTVKQENIQEFIIDECTKQNIEIPNDARIDLNKMKLNYKNVLDELRKIAEGKNGKVLSTIYLGATHKLKFRCENEHEWEATPMGIKAGRWCPDCARNPGTFLQKL